MIQLVLNMFIDNHFVLDMIGILVTQVFFGSLYYIQAFKPIRECFAMLKLIDSNQELSVSRSRTLSTSKYNLKDKKKTPKTWVKYIDASKENFETFMNHLVKEFCVETMLFVLEMMQWKRYISVQTNTKKDDPILGKIFDINTLSSIPQSSIICKSDTIMEQINQFKLKYLDFESPLEINISSVNHTEIMNKINQLSTKYENISPNDIGNDSLQEIITVFDIGLRDMSKLLDTIYFRFKYTLNKTNDADTDTQIVSQLMTIVK